jgi:hypothetical protein
MRPGRWLTVLLLGFVFGCDNEATVETSSNCLEACVGVSADVDINAQMAIATELRDSLEHARAGLAVYASTAQALTGFVQAMVDLKPSMPSGLSYEGNGLYSAKPNADTRVELSFYLASNTSFGAAGDRISFNLFNVGNYFASFGVKATTSIGLSGVSSSVSFTFDSAGPGAELLGIASTATSPIAVDVSGFTKQLSKVIIHANVIVSHASDTANIDFTLAPDARAVGAVGSAAIPLTFGNFTGQGLDFDQTLTLNSATLALRNAGSAFDGTLRFSATSPDFGFDMLFSYSASAKADIVFGCTGATLVVP